MPWQDRIVVLLTISGIDRASTYAILAEIGPDFDVFGSSERLAAWAGLCPSNGASAGKRRVVIQPILKGKMSLHRMFLIQRQTSARQLIGAIIRR